jgi:outer membrane protein
VRSILIATLAAGSLAAQESVVHLGVDEAVERALEHSPRLRALGANERAAKAAVSEAEADELPRLDLSASYTRYSDVPEFTVPSAPGGTVLFPNIPNSYRARVGARYPLYTGGRVEGLLDAARGDESSAELELETARREVAFETRRSYFRLVTALERARVLAENVEALEAHLVDARNRERYGLAARNEVLAVEVERDRAELGRLRAETDVLLAQEDARRLLGLRANDRLEPTETLLPLSRAPGDVDALVAAAVESRSELAALEAQLAAFEARARVERAARLPQVSVGGGYLYAHPNPRFLPLEPEFDGNWEVGVEVALNVFDGGRASASEARALARRDAVRAEITGLEERIRLEVVGAALEVRNASAATSIALRAVEAASENVRVAAERYREGVLLSSELLDAELALLRAELDRTEALAAERLAQAALDRALGK